MIYNIIENCSPYYIRFTFNGLSDIIDYVKVQNRELTMYNRQCSGYMHINYTQLTAINIINMLPMSKLIKFKEDRVALFSTPPGGGCGIHKDGLNHRASLNISISVEDDNCITNWYNDDQFQNISLSDDNIYSRNIYKDFSKMRKFIPIKTMIARPNEMTLFNTEIYHSWDNTESKCTRDILTLRANDVSNVYYDDIKSILFNL